MKIENCHVKCEYSVQNKLSRPEEWSRWIKRFERYLSVAGITSDDQKVNTLIYAMGQQEEDVMLMFGLATVEENNEI